ncbi:MAG: hypothetical protein ACD_16C00227G0003 [uncultured bacterium]|nr:MAG: hypothetical protein ACD_16C00227G0003 [uncultured bacterium]HBG34927.1 UDP-N-acetylmuramoyl-L-alanyl-D-glutamate--2,6-diaminopimelate ligase [Holosporales bacterium]HBW24662.1 UDP-N-acetylmuramoyl-L-alanyl-D-glutamate--2,6-diaminopimelate ligase [Holosporales bacterium]HCC25217.1 UDP-N-acetylmuramoyl-L-alanyl-D-glutamate--2,6-diaminopimelate ligase [Holosporales bacterium]HCE95826.1 UDP-N-acetylmuramoyl-L-alanyl-D-glutamate--2,6-diaminopimelate ligase [Holosporales bacterium]
MSIASLIKKGILTPLGKRVNEPTSLSINSRTLEKGGIFIAIPGFQHDGTDYIEEALTRGATGIVAPAEFKAQIKARFANSYPDVSFFITPEIRKAASYLAVEFYPLQPQNIVAVTGTNGKTSVVTFTRQIWAQMNLPAASLGTLGLIIEGKPLPPPTGTAGLNTPDPIRLHQILHMLKEDNIDHLAFEASSHGLHQNRLDSVRFKAAVFTNFTNDHLDYHQTMESYFEAKCRLFQELMVHDRDSFAVLNTDILEYEKLKTLSRKRGLNLLTFGKAGETIRIKSIVPKEGSQAVSLTVEGKSYDFNLPLVGEFQVYNTVAALGAVMACGGKMTSALEACEKLQGVPGRLEIAAQGVYVDYSHTPDGLKLALKALRPHTKGKLIVVFGCGGNRDAFKRPLMGEIAHQLADKVIVTDDNPRYENPADIRQQILAKCPGALEAASRREAIKMALKEMKPKDVVLVAGKGHETYQLIGDQAFPFNDVEEVQKCMNL